MISSLWSYIYILNHNYEHTGIVEDKKLLRTAGFGAKSPGNKSSLGISVEGSDFVAQSDGLKAILEPWLTLLWPVSTADSPRKVELSELELSINESNGSSFSRTLPLTVPPLIVPKQGSICWTWGKDWWMKTGKNDNPGRWDVWLWYSRIYKPVQSREHLHHWSILVIILIQNGADHFLATDAGLSILNSG